MSWTEPKNILILKTNRIDRNLSCEQIPLLIKTGKFASHHKSTGLPQNPNLFRQSSLIYANPINIREDWRRLADKKTILRKF